jgi:hypothetical protein
MNTKDRQTPKRWMLTPFSHGYRLRRVNCIRLPRKLKSYKRRNYTSKCSFVFKYVIPEMFHMKVGQFISMSNILSCVQFCAISFFPKKKSCHPKDGGDAFLRTLTSTDKNTRRHGPKDHNQKVIF